MKIYTKGGDKGFTSLIGGERVPKYDLRVEAYGTVDETAAQIAMLKDMISESGIAAYDDDLVEILRKLMNVEALLATGENGSDRIEDLTDEAITHLETRVDALETTLRPIDKFTIPGGHRLVSQAHICRTVCRRAERAASHAASQYPLSVNALIYLNRLSDYLYVLGRRLSEEVHAKEILWIP